MEKRFFDGYGWLEWIEPEQYWSDGWSPAGIVDGYDVVINRAMTEYRYTNI